MRALFFTLAIAISLGACQNPDPEIANQAPLKKSPTGPISTKPETKNKLYFSKSFLKGIELKRSSTYFFQNVACDSDPQQCLLIVKNMEHSEFHFFISEGMASNIKKFKSNQKLSFHYFEDSSAPADHKVKIVQVEERDQIIGSDKSLKTIKPVIIVRVLKNEKMKNYTFFLESNGNFKRNIDVSEEIYQFLEEQDPYLFSKTTFGIIYRNNLIHGLVYKNGRQVYLDPTPGESL